MKYLKIICNFFLISSSLLACAQQKEVVIKTHQLKDNIYMLEGQGGNIGLLVSEDGILMIDSQFGRLTPKILAAVQKISDKPLRFLANTHHHGDHTGGNENISETGTQIIAHDNVYQRIKANERQSDKALPVISFNDKLSLYLNDEQVIAMHFNNAHTDGDSMIYFTESNVLHTGDVFFHNRYPYIDLKSGGSIDGYIAAVKNVLILLDDETKIIPGHGQISNKEEYITFLNMLEDLRAKVLNEINLGKSEEEVAGNNNLTKFYDELNYNCCFISSEKIRRTLYRSLKK